MMPPPDGGPWLDAPQIAAAAQVELDRYRAFAPDIEVGVEFAQTGVQSLTVALIYGENQPAGDWLLSTDAYEVELPAGQPGRPAGLREGR